MARLIETNTSPMQQVEVDLVTLDLVENALRNARYEMDEVLFRTALSPGIAGAEGGSLHAGDALSARRPWPAAAHVLDRCPRATLPRRTRCAPPRHVRAAAAAPPAWRGAGGIRRGHPRRRAGR